MNKMSVSVAFVAFLAMLLLLQCAAAHTVHTVGDSMVWKIPENNDDYQNWAQKNKFAVGDTLFFNFQTGEHDVLEVPKESYESCSSKNAISNIITTGPANVTLSSVGDHYYICTLGRHCVNGQKLAVTVSASHSTTLPPSSSPGPTSPGSPSAPGSSASGVYASFFLVLLSIAIAMVM